MNDTNIALLAISALGFVVTVVSYMRDRTQQRTIDRLTDKLMARNYVEYKSMNGVKEEDASPTREDDEPKSWHDH